MIRDVMLDLETMGTDPDAPIIAIGAVAMDLDAGTVGNEFYKIVDLGSAMKQGAVVEASTIMWWMQQNDEARQAVWRGGIGITEALENFSNWIHQFDTPQVWGNGANFDNVILASSYARAGKKAPWNYWNDRCFRTLKATYPQVRPENQRVAHNALQDAIDQAHHWMAIKKIHRQPVLA